MSIEQLLETVIHKQSMRRIWVCIGLGVVLFFIVRGLSSSLTRAVLYSMALGACHLFPRSPAVFSVIGLLTLCYNLLIKLKTQGWQGLKEHFAKQLLESLVPAALAVVSVFLLLAVLVMPYIIWRDASQIDHPRAYPARLSPPQKSLAPINSLTAPIVAACLDEPNRPYKCKSNAALGQWMITEATNISSMAAKATQDVLGWRKEEPVDQSKRYSYETRIQSIGYSFSDDMMRCCMADMAAFRSEVLLRLGPEGYDSEEERDRTVLDRLQRAAQHFKRLNPHIRPPIAVDYGIISAYAPYLKKMGEQLKTLKDQGQGPPCMNLRIRG